MFAWTGQYMPTCDGQSHYDSLRIATYIAWCMEILQELMSYTYDHIPVPMREFVESEEYLGMKGQVYPRLLDDLEELFDSKKYNEAVLTGGIGLSN